MTHPVLIAAFSDELSKIASPVTAVSRANIPYSHLAAMAAGAGLLWGGKRVVDDVRTAEELRAQQRAQQRAMGQGGWGF